MSALQFSIAAANVFLGLSLLMWLLNAIATRRLTVPRFFYPLAAYAALTLVSAAFSDDPNASFIDSKQLVLFLVVPMVYDLARGTKAPFVVQVIITVGAVSALYGIFQFGVLQFDNLGQRPRGALGHYMTYSGVLMLVTCAAAARILFTRDRIWPSLMMPALLVILGLTFTRSALVGACAGIAFLLLLKDLRLMAVMPVLAALFFVLAPPQVTNRFMSMFDARDPTRVDRVTMLKVGSRMVKANPLVGVGPTRVGARYREFLDPNESGQRGSAPAQRADADRGRAGPARARGMARDARDARHRHGAPAENSRHALPRRIGPRLHGGDVRGRPRRVQLRRLRIPDVVPRAHDAALRREARDCLNVNCSPFSSPRWRSPRGCHFSSRERFPSILMRPWKA